MDDKIKHDISNYVHQIVGYAGLIEQNKDVKKYSKKIQETAFKIDAIITDATSSKGDIDLSKNSSKAVDFDKISSLKVMIVDDIDENIMIMENIFATLQCETVSANSGEEALAVFKSGYMPDIVCMDIIMPGIDGARTTKELKLLGCKAYFIAISALKDYSQNIESIFDVWLPKPFTLEHIIGALSGYNHKQCINEQIAHSIEFKTISKEQKQQILLYAKSGAYSALENEIEQLEDGEDKEFLLDALNRMNLHQIINAIVSS